MEDYVPQSYDCVNNYYAFRKQANYTILKYEKLYNLTHNATNNVKSNVTSNSTTTNSTKPSNSTKKQANSTTNITQRPNIVEIFLFASNYTDMLLNVSSLIS